MTADPYAILEKLAKEVEASVHAMYRGEVRQQTARTRAGQHLTAAKAALAEALGGTVPVARPAGGSGAGAPAGTPAARPSGQAPVAAGAASGWTREEADAVMRCINAWLPMGSSQTTLPETKCIAAGKMLVPSWGEREVAREAVRRLA